MVGSAAAERCGAYEATPLSTAAILVGENLRVNSEFCVTIQAGRLTAACTSAAAGPIDLLTAVLVAATADGGGFLSEVNGREAA